MLRLKRLKAKGCRGILHGPDLEFGPDGVLLAGDNGTGKSSYVDALEKVLTGRCGSLDTGDQGLSWAKHGRHIASEAAPEIELLVEQGGKEFSIGLDRSANPGSEVSRMLKAACRQSFLLRRRTLLAFINAKPAERYRTVADFLRIDDFNAFEAQLKQLLARSCGLLAEVEEQEVARESAVRRRLAAPASEPLTRESCVRLLNAKLTAAELPIVAELSDAAASLVATDHQLSAFGMMEEVRRLQFLESAVSALPDGQCTQQLAERYLSARCESEAEAAKLSGTFSGSVLKDAAAWIRNDDRTHCPVCESQIDTSALLARLDQRLQAHQALTATRSRESDARRSFETGMKSLHDALCDVDGKWRSVFGPADENPAEPIAQFLRDCTARHQTLQPIGIIQADVTALREAALHEVRASMARRIERKLSEFSGTERYERLTTAKAALEAIVVDWIERERLEREISRLSIARTQLTRITALAEHARKKAVQQLLDDIADYADRYYQKIHPGENIGSPVLKVTERGTASIDLTGAFHANAGDPRGCYSEGHVDSLGLCIFLAIRRLHHSQDGSLALLVLDDVLHSVDGEHRMGTAKLILDEFSDHQIVLTTHDQLWFENLKAVANRAGRRFRNYRIASWSLATGPIWGDHLSDFEWLTSTECESAKPADRVIKSGRLLEQILQNLCDTLGVPVPFSLRGRYTVDPLWSSFLKRAKGNPAFWAAASTSIEKIEELRALRNLAGAHYNEWAQLLTDRESRDLSDAIVKLRSSVYCQYCHEFVKRISGLDGVWSCKREHLRYK